METGTIKQRLKGLSLSQKMFSALLLACVVMSMISGVIHLNYTKKLLIKTIEGQVLSLAHHVAYEFEGAYA